MSRWYRFRKFTFLGALLLAVAVLFTFASFEVTSSPDFCGTCHIMRPYYNSWKTSSHNKIACVDCHIPPGITSELRKKYEAISMVVRYFTATYGTHPWAEVDDVICLQCHERRLIAGKESFKKGILFDHTPHLTEMRRGKKLRCTSCHSQIVQGSHIAVTTTTCVLCHFKDQPAGTSTARCQLCHGIPEKVITRAGLKFDHGDVKRFDMKCNSCHAGVVRGEGDVPRNRCLSCHNEPARLEKFSDTEGLHKIHVTDHKVECLHCHDQIQHGIQKEIHSGENSCESCHKGGHSPQQNLYAGTGGKGVSSQPNPMFLAGVTCEGCHFQDTGEAGAEVKRATRISCMTCHGAHFANIFERWQTLTKDRLNQTKEIVLKAEKQLPTPYPEAFRDAQDNLRLLERAVPIHNVDYSLALFDETVKLVDGALREKGRGSVAIPWQTIPFTSPCLSCHQGIEKQTGSFRGKPFLHYPHVIQQKLECDTCHVPHEIPVKTKPMARDLDCASCHHDTGFSNACQKCHATDIGKGVQVRGKILDRKGLIFDHAMHLESTEKTCIQCHFAGKQFVRTPAAENCADCHS